jgi:hypothetical protein
LSTLELMAGAKSGFHAFVDFIWAKREGRLTRIARGVSAPEFDAPGYLKSTHAIKEKARCWYVSDMSHRDARRVEKLTAAEAAYPLQERIDDTIMVDRARSRWTPAQDPRI